MQGNAVLDGLGAEQLASLSLVRGGGDGGIGLAGGGGDGGEEEEQLGASAGLAPPILVSLRFDLLPPTDGATAAAAGDGGGGGGSWGGAGLAPPPRVGSTPASCVHIRLLVRADGSLACRLGASCRLGRSPSRWSQRWGPLVHH